jgi:hypothetical protein
MAVYYSGGIHRSEVILCVCVYYTKCLRILDHDLEARNRPHKPSTDRQEDVFKNIRLYTW